MGTGQAVLFYGRWSVGEGLSLGEAWDAMFTLSGAISWVGKQAKLNCNVLSLWEGQQLIALAITEWYIEARGPGHPHSHLPALLSFRFCNQNWPPWEERLQSTYKCVEEPRPTCWTSHHGWGQVPQCGWDHSQMQWDPWAALTLTPSPSLDCRFRNDRSSVSTSSSVSSWSDRLGAPGIYTMANATGSQEANWKSICQSSRTKTRRTLSLIKVGIGI